MWRMERQWEGEDRGEPKIPFHPLRDQDASVSCCGLGCIKWSYSENKGRANGSFLYPKPEKWWPHRTTHDTAATEERAVLSLVILMTSKAYQLHLKASQITQERKTLATYTDMSLFGLKRTRCAESWIVFPPYQKPTHLILLMTTWDT